MTLRSSLLAAAAILGLCACGDGGDRQAMLSAFQEAGIDANTSECMADKAKADMEPQLYDAMVEAAKSNDDSLEQLSVQQQGELGAFMLEAALECSPLNLE
ncbi:MAG: hypothetical protein AAFQ22_02115 [Pseudomonadota bacterium]